MKLSLQAIYQFGRFFIVGLLNTGVDLVVLNLLIATVHRDDGLYYSLFKAISFVVANTNSYFWNKYWTFKSTGTRASVQEFGKFFSTSLVSFVVNVSAASLVFHVITPSLGLSTGVAANLAALCGSAASMVSSFVLLKLLVFRS